MHQLRHADGSPVTLGLPIREDLGRHSGVTILREDEPMGNPTAPTNGMYERNGLRFMIAAGDELPDGAHFVDADEEQELSLPSGAVSDEATVTIKVTELEEFQEFAADYEATLKELEAVKAERDALLAEKVAPVTGGEDDDQTPEPPADPKKGAPETKAKKAAPENRSN